MRGRARGEDEGEAEGEEGEDQCDQCERRGGMCSARIAAFEACRNSGYTGFLMSTKRCLFLVFHFQFSYSFLLSSVLLLIND